MNKIEKLKAEIERQMKFYDEKEMKAWDDSEQGDEDALWYQGHRKMCAKLLTFLDTLEEESDKSLEEAAMRYAIPAYMKDVDDNYLHEYPRDPIAEKAFIAGAQWQEKRNEETIKTAEDHAFLAGADWQKEQMLKDAVEGEAEELYNDGESQCTVGVGTYFKPGERVYVLKAMEDEE